MDWEPIEMGKMTGITRMFEFQGIEIPEVLQIEAKAGVDEDLMIEAETIQFWVSSELLMEESDTLKSIIKLLKLRRQNKLIINCSFETAQKLIHYVNHQEVISPDLELLEVASMYGMKYMKRMIEKELIQDVPKVTIENCISLLRSSDKSHSDQLKETILEFIIKNWPEIQVSCPDYMTLDRDLLLDIINFSHSYIKSLTTKKEYVSLPEDLDENRHKPPDGKELNTNDD